MTFLVRACCKYPNTSFNFFFFDEYFKRVLTQNRSLIHGNQAPGCSKAR